MDRRKKSDGSNSKWYQRTRIRKTSITIFLRKNEFHKKKYFKRKFFYKVR
jgi:hypothetical protein